MTEADRIKYLRIALLVVGLILHSRPVAIDDLLALWLVLASRRSLRVSRNDFRHLCHARRVLDYRLA
jgi:hypothetical protein